MRVNGGFAVRRGGQELRGAVSIATRELTRFSRNRIRVLSSLVQPLLFLFVLGTGLAPVMDGVTEAGFRAFLFPGILGMSLLFAGMFSAMSIVWDREFGFLREMMVAPIARSAVVMGKCLGGASVAAAQALLLLTVAPLAGVRLSPSALALLIPQVLLIAMAFTALGVAIATFVERIESFPVLSQFVVLPMFFLSSAFFPIANLPAWMTVPALLNPMTYAVNSLRRTVVGGMDEAAIGGLMSDLSWGSWTVPAGVELLVVATVGAAALSIGLLRFSRIH